MAYEALTTDEIQPGQPVTNELCEKIKYNFDYLYGLSGSSASVGVPNASLEIDADEDGVPDQWTRHLYAGGTGAFETDDPAHGSRAYKFVHPGGAGNGGGYLTSDYIEAAAGAALVGFWLKCTNAATKVLAELLCYDEDQIQLAGDDDARGFYRNATDNPTDWSFMVGAAVLPAGTRYVKLRFYGGVDDVDEAGTVYFDFPRMFYPRPSEAGSFLNVITHNSAAEREAVGTSYQKVKEITVAFTGTLAVAFDLRRNPAGPGTPLVYGRVYRNGGAVGTEQSTNSATYVNKSQDIAGWAFGDTCELWLRSTYSAGVHSVFAKNFRVTVHASNEPATDIVIHAGAVTYDQDAT